MAITEQDRSYRVARSMLAQERNKERVARKLQAGGMGGPQAEELVRQVFSDNQSENRKSSFKKMIFSGFFLALAIGALLFTGRVFIVVFAISGFGFLWAWLVSCTQVIASGYAGSRRRRNEHPPHVANAMSGPAYSPGDDTWAVPPSSALASDRLRRLDAQRRLPLPSSAGCDPGDAQPADRKDNGSRNRSLVDSKFEALNPFYKTAERYRRLVRAAGRMHNYEAGIQKSGVLLLRLLLARSCFLQLPEALHSSGSCDDCRHVTCQANVPSLEPWPQWGSSSSGIPSCRVKK